MRESEWGEKRPKVLGLLVDGKPKVGTVTQVAYEAGVSLAYVYRIMSEEQERIASLKSLPADGSLPDDLPLLVVKFMFPMRAWGALMNYGWAFKENAPLGVLRNMPDNVLLGLPQLGKKAVRGIREKFGYGADYPATARRLFQ